MARVSRALNRLRSGRLLRGATGTLAIKVVSNGLMFLISVVLARLLGASDFGIYALVLTWVGLLTVVGNLGLERLAIREVAAFEARSEWGFLRGFLRRANQAVLAVSLLLATGAALILVWRAGVVDPRLVAGFLVGMLLVPINTLGQLRESALRGLHHVVKAQVPGTLLRPGLLLVCVGLVHWTAPARIGVASVLGLGVLSGLVALAVYVWLLGRHLPRAARQAPPTYRTRQWAKSALPMLVVAAMFVVNYSSGVAVLGFFADSEAVGVFRIAFRLAEFMNLAAFALAAPLAPMISSLYATGQLDTLQRTITRAARVVFAVGAAVGAGLVVFGSPLLSLFGKEFVQGYPVLVILCFGRLAVLLFGPVVFVAVMTRNERLAAVWVSIGAAATIGFSLALIPIWGTTGAATATASAQILWMGCLAVLVWRRIGINSTVPGRPHGRLRAPATGGVSREPDESALDTTRIP